MTVIARIDRVLRNRQRIKVKKTMAWQTDPAS
jgi:hypothetical protein